MSDMLKWAQKEIEIACKKEREGAGEEDSMWADYGCACYKSALRAFESLLGDGHSGMSISITKNILNRLIDGKPLTPIEDTEDIWGECFSSMSDTCKKYQCKRMSSLFKRVYPDGTVEYDDVGRCYCVNVDDPDVTFHNGLVSRYFEEMFPITMPYYPPTKPVRIEVEDCLFDDANGDYDTMRVSFPNPNAETDGVPYIDRYFKDNENPLDRQMVEISEYEWRQRVKMAIRKERN